MIQMHGGVGMTTANPAGLFLKRARVLECLLGGRGDDGERYAELSGV
jgi:alkylation response protein AidB-like acyl-CoA dehydrogenase